MKIYSKYKTYHNWQFLLIWKNQILVVNLHPKKKNKQEKNGNQTSR